MRHLIANDFDIYIDKRIKVYDMNIVQIKSDNAFQSIIIIILDESTQMTILFNFILFNLYFTFIFQLFILFYFFFFYFIFIPSIFYIFI